MLTERMTRINPGFLFSCQLLAVHFTLNIAVNAVCDVWVNLWFFIVIQALVDNFTRLHKDIFVILVFPIIVTEPVE